MNVEDELKAWIDSAVDAVLVIDPTGRIHMANQAAGMLFGYAADQLPQMQLEDLVPQRLRAGSRKRVRAFVAGSRVRRMGQGRYLIGLHGDGTEFPIEAMLGPLVIGERFFVAVTVRDVVRRRTLEAELQQYRDQLAHVARVAFAGEMVAGITHELNQPFAAIRLCAETLQQLIHRQMPDREDLLGPVNLMVEQTDRAGAILRGLREFLQRRGQREEVFTLTTVVERAVRFLASSAALASIRIGVQIPDGLPAVRGDALQVGQVLDNLLRNAFEALVDAERPERQIRIAAEDTGEMVLLRVEDSGPGIEPAKAGEAFEQFVTTKPGGMGVGLAISRTLAEANGGELWFERSAMLGGAAFCLTLPVAE